MKKFYDSYLNNKLKVDKGTFIGIICLLVVIAGIIGFLYEYLFYFFNSGMKTFYWRGANFLPWINIYATGALMIWFLTRKHKKSPLKVFLISLISTGILEFFSGLVMYEFFGLRCWDYNTEILSFGNIGGFVCIRSVLAFALSGLLLMYVLLPCIYYVALHIPKKIFLIISISLFVIFISDELYNLLISRIFNLPRAKDIYMSIGFKYMNYRY